MEKEIKICFPLYKIVYSVFFAAVLSVIRGVSFTYEVGIALEPMMALLAAVFCADTYVQEIAAKRSEVERLYPMKNRITSMFRRIGVQELYLFVLSAVGYGLFLIIQKPVPFYGAQSGGEQLAGVPFTGLPFTEQQLYEMEIFGIYLAAIAVTLMFWGMLSHTLSCIFRTMWAGIGGCLPVWLLTNSVTGVQLFGKWNVFSYTFRNIEDGTDWSWICGKAVCLILTLIMAGLLPGILRKRG